MHFLIFAITYPFIWLLSLLPMKLLYVLSDVFYWILFYLVRYRKDVVLENLALAFPEKNQKELKRIQKKFFHHISDLVFESIKFISISEKVISQRYQFTNPKLLQKLNDSGKSILLLATHYGNWEYLSTMSLITDVSYYGSYTRIRNPYFERVIKKMRSRFGMICIQSEKVVKNIVFNIKENNQGIYLLISDQSPHEGKMKYWSEFIGVTVPVLNGAEIISNKLDVAVVNINTTKVKRGFYESEFNVLTESSQQSKNNQITELYLRSIEKHIRKAPEYYLWSHKRFKHRDKVPEGYKKRT